MKNGVDDLKRHIITLGICKEIPIWLQNLMWFLWESMDVAKKDALQRFSLSCENGMQKIEHAQTRPLYRKVIKIPTDEKTICKEVIILETSYSLTMILNDEY